MKHFTLNGRFFASLVAVICFAFSATAGNTLYAFYAKYSVYPTGKGQIYVSDNAGLTEDKCEFTSEPIEVKEVSSFYNRYVYAKPAEGYLFAGISLDTAVVNADGETVGYEYSGIIDDYNNPAMSSFESFITDYDGTDPRFESNRETVEGLMPLDPNGQISVVFTRVIAAYATGQNKLGTITISKVANEIGDEITLVATPKDSLCHFDHWSLNGVTVSTDSAYTITVTGPARYVAHFTSEYAELVNFPESGAYMPYYCDDAYTYVPENVEVLTFYNDSVNVGANGNYIRPSKSLYGVPVGQPVFLYGKGDATFVFEDDNYYENENMLNRWSGNGVKLDTLDQRYAYYTFNTKDQRLELIKTETLGGYKVFVAVPDSFFTTAPEVFYLDPEVAFAAGITTLKSIDVPGVGRIYTIDGREVNTPEEQKLYIIDGKKVIYRKK